MKRVTGFLALATATALLAAGCGSGTSASGSGDTGAPVNGGILRAGIPGNPDHLDPALCPFYPIGTMPMRARLNGDPVELPDGLSVADLLRHLGVRAERVAVERNGAVVKRAHHVDEKLAEGDVLEIVTFVGGG